VTEKIDWQPGMVAKCMHVHGFIRFVRGQKETVQKVTVFEGNTWLHFGGDLGCWFANRFKPVYRVKARGVRVPHAFNRQEHWDMLLASVPGRCEMVSA
jgi:hypothetical protein